MRVVDDRGKFRLQDPVELRDYGIDVELKSPCHRGSPSLGDILVVGTILAERIRLGTRPFIRVKSPCGLSVTTLQSFPRKREPRDFRWLPWIPPSPGPRHPVARQLDTQLAHECDCGLSASPFKMSRYHSPAAPYASDP
jgi:hypothetical protein